jgi:hypothetical protein
MKTLAAFALLLTSLPLFAAKHAPLPDAVMQAKTVYIVNQSGRQDIADSAYAEFSKWGRFSVAKTKESADIVAIFTSTQRLTQGTTHNGVEMSIYSPGSEDALYQTTPRPNGFHSIGGIAKICVQDLEKRINEKQ